MAKDLNKLFFESIQYLIFTARVRLKASFENTAVPDQALWYHCLDHTEGVDRRAVKIMKICNHVEHGTFSARKSALVRLAVYFHDIYIASYIVADPNTPHLRLSRKRFVGGNEQVSVALLHRCMHEQNSIHACKIFLQKDFDFVAATIVLTVPIFEGGTVIQPITGDMPLAIRILPLADLGECSMEPTRFARSDDLLLCEEQPLIQASLMSDVSRNIGAIREDILAWSASQERFVVGRRERTKLDLDGVAPSIVEALSRECFTGFDESLAHAIRRFTRRKTMTYAAIVKEMRVICGIH